MTQLFDSVSECNEEVGQLALDFFDSVSECNEEVGQLALDFFDSVSEYDRKKTATGDGAVVFCRR